MKNMKEKPFAPFQNDSQSITINQMTFENGTEEIIMYGDLTITKSSSAKEIDNLIEILTNIKNSLHPSVQNKPK